ncbi:MAG: thioesterase [Lachnospiraceae bacterium]
MYSFDSRIRYSEVNKEGKITLNSVLNYFQDCSFFHSEDIGIGIKYLEQEQKAWVLNAWQVQVKRYPGYGEGVTISTWPYSFKGFLGGRNFTMKTQEGEMLAYANSTWTLLDLQTMHPTRLLPKMKEVYQLSKELPMEQRARKILLPKEMKAEESFSVHHDHIDTNQHVNNGRYVGMAQEYLPETFEIGRMRAEYKKAAVYGDIIYPFIAEETGKIIVNLADREENPYAIIELEETI